MVRRTPAASVRRLLAVAVAVAALGSASPAQGAIDDGGVGAIDRFGACLATQRSGDLLLLIDESASLRTTDADASRVTAATYLLEQLQASTARSGVELEAAVAGFSADFELVGDWTPLDATGLPGLVASVESFAERDGGIDTDYWNALEGARQVLADRPAPEQGRRCQAIVWFSDGQLDIEARDARAEQRAYPDPKAYAPGADLRTDAGAAAAEAAAQESLCRSGGLADQLRAAGVGVFGVGLADPAAPPDLTLMTAAVTGTAGTLGCGDLTSPPPGEFFLASDIDDLLFAFDRISNPGAAPVEQEHGVCQVEQCVEEEHRFVLDSSVRSVHILGSADVAGLDVVVVPPSGVQVPLRPATVGLTTVVPEDGVQISFGWQSPRSVVVDLAKGTDPQSWSGVWSVVFVDPDGSSPDAVSRTNVHIAGDAFPAVVTSDVLDALHSGDVVDGVRLGVVDATGEVVDLSGFEGTVSLSAALVDDGVTRQVLASDLGAAQLGDPIAIDLTGVEPGPATIRLELEVTTADAVSRDGELVAGTVLAPQRADVPVTVLPPLNYPRVADRLDFGAFPGEVDAVAMLGVTGPGCVWVEGGDALTVTAAPAETGRIQVVAQDAVSAATCLQVADGESAELPLRMTTENAGNGAVHGAVTVRLAPLDDVTRATQVEVAVVADLRKPIYGAPYWLTLVTALVLGPGIPIALLYLLKHATAKIPPRALSARRVDVRVRNGQVLREDAPFRLRDTDVVHLVHLGGKGARRTTADGVELATSIGRSPFGPGYTRVVAPGLVGASSTHPRPAGRRREARLPLAVHNTWAVLHDPSGPADRATVLVLVGADAPDELRRGLEDDVAQRVPEVLAGLLEAAPSGRRPPRPSQERPDDPFARTGSTDVGAPFTFTRGFATGDDVVPLGPGDPSPWRPGDPGADASPTLPAGDTAGPGDGRPTAGGRQPYTFDFDSGASFDRQQPGGTVDAPRTGRRRRRGSDD